MWELSSVFCYFSFRFICFVLLLWKAWQGRMARCSSCHGLPQGGRSKMEGREEGRFGGKLGAWIGKSPKG